MKKTFGLFRAALLAALMTAMILTGCAAGQSLAEAVEPSAVDLADGIYVADFNTDSSMFRVNEANANQGILTVADGKAAIHVSLISESILNLFPGSAEDARKEGAVWLEPTTDIVTYSDGSSEEVFGFDIPVPAIDEEFELALVGTKGKWYDHLVSVSNPEVFQDGQYTIEVTLEGGTGRASVNSPAPLMIQNGQAHAALTWSSPYYEWMQINGAQYKPVNTEGNSAFLIPVIPDRAVAVSAQTIAMSQPHVVDYTLRFHSSTIQAAH